MVKAVTGAGGGVAVALELHFPESLEAHSRVPCGAPSFGETTDRHDSLGGDGGGGAPGGFWEM